MPNTKKMVTDNMVTDSAGPADKVAGSVVSDDKIEQFRAAVADLKLRTNRTGGDLVRQVAGAVLMVGGFVAALIDYEESLSQSSALNLASEQIFAISMICVVVIGAALFVSASLARFLRLWMLRQLYEGQAHTEQLVDSFGGTRRL